MPSDDLLLIPGHLCDARIWEHQARHLSSIRSVSIVETTKDDSMAAIAARALASAPQTFALAGFSMGGMVAMEIMRQAPERVDRLALLDTNATSDLPERAIVRTEMLERARSGQVSQVVEEFLDLLLPLERRHEIDLVEEIRVMMERVASHAIENQVSALLTRPDSRVDLSEYDLPCLILCGRQDKLTPLSLHEEMAAAIPGARLAVIEECAHMSTMERPQAVTALLRDWLLYR